MFVFQNTATFASASTKLKVNSTENVQEHKSQLVRVVDKAVETKQITPEVGAELKQKLNSAQTNQDLYNIARDMRDKYGIKDNLLDTLINQLKKATGTNDSVDAGSTNEQVKNTNMFANANQSKEEDKAVNIVKEMDPRNSDGFFKAV